MTIKLAVNPVSNVDNNWKIIIKTTSGATHDFYGTGTVVRITENAIAWAKANQISIRTVTARKAK